MTQYQTVRAAEALLVAATRDTWSLADAVLADVPEPGDDGPVRKAPVGAQLEEIVAALEDAGVTTPNGDLYDRNALAKLRLTALQWPVHERHEAAAFRTHQGAGGPNHRGRIALAGLARVAAGEDVPAPDGFDPKAWTTASDRVRAKVAKGQRRFVIAVNDLRIALEQKSNIPMKLEISSVPEMLEILSGASSALRRFMDRFDEIDPIPADRLALAHALRQHAQQMSNAATIVSTLTDDLDNEYHQLLKGEAR